MTKEAGLWIDHEHAVIVTLLEEGEDIKHITSSVSTEGHDDSAEDKRERRNDVHLNKYYDEIIALLHNTDSILILGPGEAKGQLEKRFPAKFFQSLMRRFHMAAAAPFFLIRQAILLR